MPKKARAKTSRWLLGASILAMFGGGQAQDATAQAPAEPAVTEETVIITATRRDSTVQDAPINIAAVTSTQLEQQGLSDLAAAAAWVPSVHLVDQGGRTPDRIVVRGLNVDTLSQTDVIGNNAGGSVATYVGETPMYLDLKLNDVDRVEFLLGPQGTLYGQGTLSGAIRYIPTKPKFNVASLDVRAESYAYAHADSLSYDRGLTFNKGWDNFAVRLTLDKLEDSGFIDYNYVVRQPGAVNANVVIPGTSSVNGGDPYDLTPVKDANSEDTWSGRTAFRWEPVSWLDTTFTYYFQHNRSGGRTVTNKSNQLPVSEDDYVAPQRVLEPNSRDNKLYAWENELDLGFASLTSSTSYAKFKERGQRDQTVLLTTLEYSYEAFPFFTAVTREEQVDTTFTQEMRLVSKNDGPLNWIVGGFYSDFKSEGFSAEYTPGFSQFNLDNGAPGVLRADDLEYYAPGTQDLTELAAYGELSYDITPKWQVTGGMRWYKYKLKTADAADLPLYYTTIDPDGRAPDEIILDFTNDGQRDDGFLYKFNTSYDFTDDILGYFTISEGYRVGGGNGVTPCGLPLPPPAQTICGLPNELSYAPDTTLNYELGAHTQWFDKTLTLNGSVFYVKWDKPQLVSATTYGSATITKNGEGAETKGFDIAANWRATDNLSFRASYAYTKAELTAIAPCLVATVPTIADQSGPPFSYDCGEQPPSGNFTTVFENGQDGDRLPGSPEHQASFFVDYTQPISPGMDWSVNYGVTAISDVLTRTGGRGGFPKLDGYAVHNLSTSVEGGDWKFTVYAQNLLDEYAETGISGNDRFEQVPLTDINGDEVLVRAFYANPIAPRAIGVRLTKSFGP